jgi:hypothetical protein
VERAEAKLAAAGQAVGASTAAVDEAQAQLVPARVESLGWGVGEGDVDPTTGLPKTHQDTVGYTLLEAWRGEPTTTPGAAVQ